MHERTAKREHLPLATGQSSGGLLPAFLQPRKSTKHVLQVALCARAVALAVGAEQEIVGNGQVGKQLAFLGDETEPALDAPLDVHPREVRPLEDHPPRGPQEPHRRHKQRGLAGAIRANHRHDLSFLDRQRDVSDGLHLAIGDTDIFDREHLRHATPPR